MTTVLWVLALVVVIALFGTLFWWTRKSERDIDYDKPGLPDEQANALRFGIAVSATQSFSGGQ
jgi:cytochrome c-type biogenesis protein CcmH/NrfF